MPQLSYFEVTGIWEPSSTEGLIHGDVSFTMLVEDNGALAVPTLDIPAIVVPIVYPAAIVNNTLTPVSLLANTAALNLSGTLYYTADFSNVYYNEPGEPPAALTLESVTFAASTDTTPINLVDVTPAAGVVAGQIPSVTSANISDATTLGRELLTVANADAARTDLGAASYLDSVASQSAMLELTGDIGDYCYRTDVNAFYYLIGTPASTLSNWSVAGGGLSAPSAGMVKTNGSVLQTASAGTDYASPFWVNILDKGADRTGATPSDTALAEAYAALSFWGGRVYAPAGQYSFADDYTFNQFQRLVGDGKDITTLKYTGSGTFITATETTSVSSADSPAGFAGFTIDGTSAGTGAIGLKIGDLYNTPMDDICIQNFGSTGAIGLYFNNSGAKPDCERSRVTGVSLLFNTNGVVFDTGSFDYGVYEFHVEAGPNQNGITAQNGATLYGCRFALRGNFGAGTGSNSGWVLAVDPGNTSGTSSIQNAEFDIAVECDGTSGQVGHKTLVMGSSLPTCAVTGTGVMVFVTSVGSNPQFQGAAITTGSRFGMSGIVNDVVLGPMIIGDSGVFHGGTQYAVHGSNTNTLISGQTVYPLYGDIQEFLLPSGSTTIAAISTTGLLRARKMELLLHQPSSGAAGTITWPGNVQWAGGRSVLSTANGAVDKVRLTYFPADNVWYGEVSTNFTASALNPVLTNPIINGYTEGVQALGTVTTSRTIPALTNGTLVTATLTNGDTCDFTLPTPVQGMSFTLFVQQPSSTGTGLYSFTSPTGSVLWPGAGTPVMTQGANSADRIAFDCADGTNWYGSAVQGYTV